MGDEVTCDDLGDTFPSVEDFNKGPSTYNVCSEEFGHYPLVSLTHKHKKCEMRKD